MATLPTRMEFETHWLPNATDRGLERIVELLESASPLLIHGSFTRCASQGCLATHLAWHHPETEQLQAEAGIAWLSRVAELNPATSAVLLEWDRYGVHDWTLRTELLAMCREELRSRSEVSRGVQFEDDLCFA